MADLIDITSSILSQNTICFESRNINKEHISIPMDDAKFGILNFKAVTTCETKDELELLFVVDCSGSMSDKCSDGRTKMQHIIHTLKNMIMFFYEHSNIKVNITVSAFDTKIYPIIGRTKITEENIDKIISKIEKIIPRCGTNIEFALRETANKINELKILYPNNIISHIFMTDGEATDGSNEISVLQSIVNPDILNAFIGFGIEHDSSLLNGISSVGKSAYYFIDKLESAGLVYGEILHGIVYKLLIETEIIMKNGLIYDYKTNSWTQKLYVGDIVSEADRIFNIISSNPVECEVNIRGRMDNLVILFPSTQIDTTDLSSHIFRQRTLELLYEVNEFCERKREFYIDLHLLQNDENENINSISDEAKKLRLKLVNFIQEIKNYITENNLENDKFLKNLSDDVYVCYRTFGTKYGNMFCTARQTSQGTQRLYTVSNTDDIDIENQYLNSSIRVQTPFVPPFRRQNNNFHEAYNNDDVDELPILNYQVSDFNDTPYSTPQATQLMREISRIPFGCDEDETSSVRTTQIY